VLEIAQEKKSRGRPKGSRNRPLEERERIKKQEAPRPEPPTRFTGPAARVIALRHAERAIGRLARLMDEADTDTAKISACKEILDRAYGKAPQAITGEDGGPIQNEVIVRIIEAGIGARHPASIAAIGDTDD
jgi:hypothetical protein